MIRTRRTGVTVGVLAAALVAGALTAMGTAAPPAVPSLAALPSTPASTAPAPSGSPSATATPSPVAATPRAVPPAPASVAPTTRPLPSPPPTPSPTPSIDDAPRQQLRGRVDFPYEAGRTTWAATSNGIRLRVTISTATPKVGVPVTWTVDAASGDGDCCEVYTMFGSGRASYRQDGCPDPGRTPARYTHTYNAPGRLYFYVHAKSGGCTRSGMVTGFVEVSPGTSTRQGPSLPVVRADYTEPAPDQPSPQWLHLAGEASDADGHVGRFVVAWGDGTSQTLAGDPFGCRDAGDGWPRESWVVIPNEPAPAHRYAEPGTYTVTLTAFSSACDGSTEQSGSASFEWVVP